MGTDFQLRLFHHKRTHTNNAPPPPQPRNAPSSTPSSGPNRFQEFAASLNNPQLDAKPDFLSGTEFASKAPSSAPSPSVPSVVPPVVSNHTRRAAQQIHSTLREITSPPTPPVPVANGGLKGSMVQRIHTARPGCGCGGKRAA